MTSIDQITCDYEAHPDQFSFQPHQCQALQNCEGWDIFATVHMSLSPNCGWKHAQMSKSSCSLFLSVTIVVLMSVKWNDDSVRWHLVGVEDDTKDTLSSPTLTLSSVPDDVCSLKRRKYG